MEGFGELSGNYREISNIQSILYEKKTDLTYKVEYLEKDRETGITEEKLVYNKIFAGNIFDIYYDNMFITDTIGEFSRRKINYYLTLINNRKISSEDLKYLYITMLYISLFPMWV